MKKDKFGRPTVMTEALVNKLEEAFLLGCTDLEACFYANISKQTLYNYQKKEPDFVDRKEQLKENPVFLARKSVIGSFQEDGKLAMDYLKNKKSKEFSTSNNQNVSGDLEINVVTGIEQAPNGKDD